MKIMNIFECGTSRDMKHLKMWGGYPGIIDKQQKIETLTKKAMSLEGEVVIV